MIHTQNALTVAAALYQGLQMQSADSPSSTSASNNSTSLNGNNHSQSNMSAVSQAYLLPAVLNAVGSAAAAGNGTPAAPGTEKRPLINYTDILASFSAASAVSNPTSTGSNTGSNGGSLCPPDAKVARNRRSFHFKEKAEDSCSNSSVMVSRGELDKQDSFVNGKDLSGGQVKEEQLSPPMIPSVLASSTFQPATTHLSRPPQLNCNRSSNSGSPSPTSSVTQSATSSSSGGVPIPAQLTRLNAPVHIDVGGKAFTTTLETLTKYPNSKLAKMFSGKIPIVLDSLKQHYFVDRDGHLFRHVLNFLRNGSINVRKDPEEINDLLQEARFYEMEDLENRLLELLPETSQKRADPKNEVTDLVILDGHFSLEDNENSGSENWFVSGKSATIQKILNCSWDKIEKYSSSQSYSTMVPKSAFVTADDSDGDADANDLRVIQVLQMFLDKNYVLENSSLQYKDNKKYAQFILKFPKF